MISNIEAFIFDVGGVLYHPELPPRTDLEINLGIPSGSLSQVVFCNPVTMKAQLGQATVSDIWSQVKKILNITDAELDKIKNIMWNGTWDNKLLQYISIIKKYFKTGTISDAWPNARKNIEQYVNYKLFDVIIFSYEENILKPNPQIYEIAAKRLNVKLESCVYIDDKQKNVDGAIKIGMHGILYENSDQIIREINTLSKIQ